MNKHNPKEELTINKKSFGIKIKDARNKLGLTQFELAEKLNISQNFLGDIERGNKLPSLKKLIELSNLLKISLDYLFAGSLDNVLFEPGDIYYTDKQLAVLSNVVKAIQQNFDK